MVRVGGLVVDRAMHEKFYGLTTRPFTMFPDPCFLYWGRTHSLGCSMLEYGILNEVGFMVMTGEIGSGKTPLLRQLRHSIDRRITVGLISNTMMAEGNLLERILLGFLHQFQDLLVSEYELGRHTVLMLDKAQKLDLSALEELRMSLNINTDRPQLLQVILVGQPHLRVMLQRPELRRFAQRMASDFHLDPLSTDEAAQYIHHRLALAWADEICSHARQPS
jgi:general secretion pathway protein A